MFFRRTLRRLYFLCALHLYAKSRLSRVDDILLLGFQINVPPSVFHPGMYFSTKFLAECVQNVDFRMKKVLDFGCGSGILSLVAASKGASVTAIDINKMAVQATLANAVRNSLGSSVTAKVGDLFDALSPIEGAFDIILLNPPFYSGKPLTDSDYAWRGGDDHDFLRRFVADAWRHLTPEGRIIVVLSSDMDLLRIRSIFEAKSYVFTCLRSKRVLFENLYVFEVVYRP